MKTTTKIIFHILYLLMAAVFAYASGGGSGSTAAQGEERGLTVKELPHIEANIDVLLQTEHSSKLITARFSPDGKQIISSSDDKTIKLWDVASGRLIRTFSGHMKNVISLAFSPDGKQILSGEGYDGIDRSSVKLWDAVSGSEIKTISGNWTVYYLAFSQNGKQFVIGFSDGTAKLCDAATGHELRTFSLGMDSWIMAFSPDGNLLFEIKREIKLLDAVTGSELRTFPRMGSVAKVAFSPDGKQIFFVSNDRTVRLCDAATGHVLRSFLAPDDIITFSQDCKQIIFFKYNDYFYNIAFWDVVTGREIRDMKIDRYDATGDYVPLYPIHPGVSPDGNQIIIGSGYPESNFSFDLYDTITGRKIRSFSGNNAHITSVAFSPDGKQVISGSYDKTAKLWDVVSGRLVRTFSGHETEVNSVAFSPDGKQMISSNERYFSRSGTLILDDIESTIKLWDVASGRLIRTFSIEWSNIIKSIAFSPDGKQIISGGRGIDIWDVATGSWVDRIGAGGIL
jgi:WD40 repeat protein